LAELDDTGGTPFEIERRNWTKGLYEASFDDKLKDTMVPCLHLSLQLCTSLPDQFIMQSKRKVDNLKKNVDNQFRKAFQNFYSTMSGDNIKNGLVMIKIQLKEALILAQRYVGILTFKHRAKQYHSAAETEARDAAQEFAAYCSSIGPNPLIYIIQESRDTPPDRRYDL
jgi:hypothetical protein